MEIIIVFGNELYSWIFGAVATKFFLIFKNRLIDESEGKIIL